MRCLMYVMIGLWVIHVKNTKNATKWLLKYLKSSSYYNLFYTIDVTYQFFVKGYYNSNFATNLDKSRFLIGCVFTFGGTIISWECNL